MNKDEFILSLREELQGNIPPFEIEEHIRYYSDYLSDAGDGKLIEDKLSELGEPRLIAKTIIDTASIKIDSSGKMNMNRERTSYNQEDNTTDREDQYNNNRSPHIKSYRWDAFTWYQKLLAVLIGVLIIIAVIGIILVGVNIFFSIVLPVLIIVFIIRFVISRVRK